MGGVKTVVGWGWFNPGDVNQNSGGGYGALDKIRACPEALTINPEKTTVFGASIRYGTAHLQWGNSLLTGGSDDKPFGAAYGYNAWLYQGSLLGMSLDAFVKGGITGTETYRMSRMGSEA